MRNCLSISIPIGLCPESFRDGVLLRDNERIGNNAFVSHVRSYLGAHLNLNDFQWSLIQHWKEMDIAHLHLTMMDATCFPTDVKLLWECVEKLW